MTITCPYCGRVNRSGATFCAGCGRRLAPTAGQSAMPSSADLQRYLRQAGLALRRLAEQAWQEASGWYHELIARQPELVGEIVAGPTPTTVTQTTQFHALFLPAGSQTTYLPALSFQVRPPAGGQDQAVVMIGPLQGDSLRLGDRVRAWGVWERDLTALRAWRVEVWERGGQPASYIATTSRPWPLAMLCALVMGLLLLSCMCSLLTR